MRKYRLVAKKGEGTFSEVLKAQNVKDGKYYAIKCMKNRFDSIDQVRIEHASAVAARVASPCWPTGLVRGGLRRCESFIRSGIQSLYVITATTTTAVLVHT